MESKEEFNAITELLKIHQNVLDSNVFVDGTSPYSKSPTEWFYTRTGEKIPDIPWKEGEPNDRNGVERCLSFFPKGVYMPNDVPCNYPDASFLCEKVEFL